MNFDIMGYCKNFQINGCMNSQINYFIDKLHLLFFSLSPIHQILLVLVLIYSELVDNSIQFMYIVFIVSNKTPIQN